jgi:hypothetical protein
MPSRRFVGRSLGFFGELVMADDLAKEVKEQGDKLLRNGHLDATNYWAAIERYTVVINNHPNSELLPAVYSNRALAHMNLKRWVDAANDAQRSTELAPKALKNAYHRLALATQQLQQWSKCHEACKTALEFDWPDSTKKELLSICEVSLGNATRDYVFSRLCDVLSQHLFPHLKFDQILKWRVASKAWYGHVNASVIKLPKHRLVPILTHFNDILKVFPNITSIDLRPLTSYDPVSVRTLKALPGFLRLTHFYYAGTLHVELQQSLPKLIMLQSLALEVPDSLTLKDLLPTFAQLENLSAIHLTNGNRRYRLPPDFLPRLPRLRSLRLTGISLHPPEDVTYPLIKDLKYLNERGDEQILSAFPNLTSLAFQNDIKFFDLSALIFLTALDVVSIPAATLCLMTKLQTLSLTRNPWEAVIFLTGLTSLKIPERANPALRLDRALKNLKTLDITENPPDVVFGLGNYTTLTSLNLTEVQSCGDGGPELSSLTNLRTLNLSQNENIEFLPFLPNLRKLNIFKNYKIVLRSVFDCTNLQSLSGISNRRASYDSQYRADTSKLMYAVPNCRLRWSNI